MVDFVEKGYLTKDSWETAKNEVTGLGYIPEQQVISDKLYLDVKGTVEAFFEGEPSADRLFRPHTVYRAEGCLVLVENDHLRHRQGITVRGKSEEAVDGLLEKLGLPLSAVAEKVA